MKQSIEIYQSGEIEIEVSVEHETVWLHRQQLAELFGRDVKPKICIRNHPSSAKH